MALIKQYDTPFEKLNLEDLPEFSDPESQKLLQDIYNRMGMLNVGDKFIQYKEDDGIKQLVCGEVTGFDTYNLLETHYWTDDNLIIDFEANDDFEKNIEVDESFSDKAKMLGTTVFIKKYFVPYESDIFYKICKYLNGGEWDVIKQHKWFIDTEYMTEDEVFNTIYYIRDYKDIIEAMRKCDSVYMHIVKSEECIIFEGGLVNEVWLKLRFPNNYSILIYD